METIWPVSAYTAIPQEAAPAQKQTAAVGSAQAALLSAQVAQEHPPLAAAVLSAQTRRMAVLALLHLLQASTHALLL
jgi:hypothetical protein